MHRVEQIQGKRMNPGWGVELDPMAKVYYLKKELLFFKGKPNKLFGYFLEVSTMTNSIRVSVQSHGITVAPLGI